MPSVTFILGIAMPDQTWHAEVLDLDLDEPVDDDTLERDVIADWSGNNVRSDAIHLWRIYPGDLPEDEAEAIARPR